MKAQELTKRRERVGQFEINIATYLLGDTYYCSVDNVDPGAVVARGEGKTREEAEKIAVEKATRRVESTRIHSIEE